MNHLVSFSPIFLLSFLFHFSFISSSEEPLLTSEERFAAQYESDPESEYTLSEEARKTLLELTPKERRIMLHSLSGGSSETYDDSDDDAASDISDEPFGGIPAKFEKVPLVRHLKEFMNVEKIQYYEYKKAVLQNYIRLLLSPIPQIAWLRQLNADRSRIARDKTLFYSHKIYFCVGRVPLKEGGKYYFFYDPEDFVRYGPAERMTGNVVDTLKRFYDQASHSDAKFEFLKLLFHALMSPLFKKLLPAGAVGSEPVKPGFVRYQLNHRFLRKQLISLLYHELPQFNDKPCFKEFLADVEREYRFEFESLLEKACFYQEPYQKPADPLAYYNNEFYCAELVRVMRRQTEALRIELCAKELCRLATRGDTSAAHMLWTKIKQGWRTSAESWQMVQEAFTECSLRSIERRDPEPFLFDEDAFLGLIIDNIDENEGRLTTRFRKEGEGMAQSHKKWERKGAREMNWIPLEFRREFRRSPENKEFLAWRKLWHERSAESRTWKKEVYDKIKRYKRDPQCVKILRDPTSDPRMVRKAKIVCALNYKSYIEKMEAMQPKLDEFYDFFIELRQAEFDARGKFLSRKEQEDAVVFAQLQRAMARKEMEIAAEEAARKARSLRGRIERITTKAKAGFKRMFSRVRSQDSGAASAAEVPSHDAPMAGAGAPGFVPRTLSEARRDAAAARKAARHDAQKAAAGSTADGR